MNKTFILITRIKGETMSTNISLTPELEEYARNQVASGLYGSISEFVRSAVRLHRKQDIEHNLYLRNMHRELAQAGTEIDRGEITPLNMQEIMDEVDAEIGE